MRDLTWFGWVLLAIWVLSTLMSIGTIGQYRKPTEPGTAVVIVIINALLIAGLLFVGTNA